MIKKITRNLVAFAMISLIVLPIFAFSLTAHASNANNAVTGWDTSTGAGAGTADNVGTKLGLGSTDPRVMVASIINMAMGFLGIIAVMIILIGGFKWMTAGGAEDKVEEAGKLIKAGIIGLVIILASWAIAKFVVSSLLSATGAVTP